jgi:hypothetical protein
MQGVIRGFVPPGTKGLFDRICTRKTTFKSGKIPHLGYTTLLIFIMYPKMAKNAGTKQLFVSICTRMPF